LREERVLEFWRVNKTFEKSLEQSKDRKEFIFYEGPPTANGRPGIHHLEARAFKDVIPRYKTMRGYHVRRKGGWDTHGLPVELQVEKKLGLNSKKAIEEYGIAKFNQQCKESVWEYLDVWNKFTTRMGYWVDQEHPYVTYHNNYIESVWNIVKKINEQNLLYKDYKVVPWCPRCGTALSSHELAQGYEDVKDLAVTVKFKVKGQENTFILAWTTTPWTLPGNVALAVGKDINYSIWEINKLETKTKERLVLATNRVNDVLGGEFIEEGGDINGHFISNKTGENIEYVLIGRKKGSDLIGWEYEPLYPFLQNIISEKEKPKMAKAYKVYGANFVTTEDGTGVVHTAVMYGQDDFVLGNEIGLPKQHLVGLDGKFLPGTGAFEGRFVRDEEVAVDIIKDLASRGLLLQKEKYEHPYPFCWRCHTALIYYARDSWYIKVSDPRIKKKMIAENQTINWEPAHLRDGRFGEWLREIKDWAVSRERYWGTPLPVWQCEACKKIEVLGSVEEIKNKTKTSGNKYFVVRHGEAENNYTDGVHRINLEYSAKLTEKGKEETLESAKNFKEKVDVVICSTLERARETVKIICEEMKFPIEKVVYDERIREWKTSYSFEGQAKAIFNQYYNQDYLDKPNEILPGGESFTQLIKRIGQFVYEIETKYSNKNILIVGHGGATRALNFVTEGLSLSDLSKTDNPFIELQNAEIKKFDFVPLPHNENYELDLHRPYIDEVSLVCKCGGKLTRTKEVMDVWLDSGCMPFAQDHYPFENKKWVEGIGYPADFISEAIDQTRGWFYTLHAIGILMGRGKAFKNVICLGLLLDAKGKKMSKSLGNIVDPWDAMDKYGVDTLRLWMYSINQSGESKNFDEKTVALLHQQVFGLLYNVLAFYNLYRDKSLEKNDRPKSKNILDVWILAKLDELIDLITKNLEGYRLLEPTRATRDFIGDLSTWYLRRSRERIKEGDKDAKQTLYFVLKTLAKVMAPFAPLSTEDIWLQLKNTNDAESVHLIDWPTKPFKLFSFGESKVIENMQNVRHIVTLGLEARQKAGIKVRQPLNQLRIKNYELGIGYTELIKDELNVKEVVLNKNIKDEIELDTKITEELKEEGDYRELVRALQDMRKKIGLTPSDVVVLYFETNDIGKKLVQKFENDIKKTVLASKIEFKDNIGEEIKIDELIFKVKIEK